MWFETLTGFKEKNPNQVRENLVLDGEYLTSLANGQRWKCGTLTIPTLKTLKDNSPSMNAYNGTLKISEIVGNVQQLHQDSLHQGALFQAASQFNLLEMVGPSVTPEHGIDRYDTDYTQGPACAIACGAGTIYRNYFAEINGQIGQTKYHQIDCLDEIGKAFNNETLQLWKMQNGYALASKAGLKHISNHLKNCTPAEYEALKEKLKIGIHWDTEVTISNSQQEVTQVYCSALPVAYSYVLAIYWEAFARLVLEATYEATFYAALNNYEKTGNNQVFLTLVGGGAFGNETSWIFDAIQKAISKFKNVPLEIKIVSYGRSNSAVRAFCDLMNV